MLADLRRDWHPGSSVAALVFYGRCRREPAPGRCPDRRFGAARRSIRCRSMSTAWEAAAAEAHRRALYATEWRSPQLHRLCLRVAAGITAAFSTPVRPAADAPVLQVVFSGGWKPPGAPSGQGLSPRSRAMQVALPELSTGASSSPRGRLRGHDQVRPGDAMLFIIATLPPVPDHIAYVAELAARWVASAPETGGGPADRADPRQLPQPGRPHRQWRRPRPPAGTVNLLGAMATQALRLAALPADGAAR